MNDEKKEILNKLLEYFKESNINVFGYEQDKLISYEEAQILLDYITNLQRENIKLISENETIKNIKYTVDEVIYKSRINKAIELIEPFVEWGECTINGKILKEIVNILKGDDKYEK